LAPPLAIDPTNEKRLYSPEVPEVADDGVVAVDVPEGFSGFPKSVKASSSVLHSESEGVVPGTGAEDMLIKPMLKNATKKTGR
jgi:hypothetical protein